MPRIMSCAETTQAVLNETKTVTRRLGWWEDRNGRRLIKPGDELSLVKKSMGRKPGEPLVRLALVEVVDVRREPLRAMTYEDIWREGVPFGSWNKPDGYGFYCPAPAAFLAHSERVGGWIRWYADSFGRDPHTTDVTRIEWRYLHPVGRMSWGPTVAPDPCIEWDDGKRRPLTLVPDHLRHLHNGEIPEYLDPLPPAGRLP